MRSSVLTIFLLFSFNGVSQAVKSKLWADLNPGIYDVGFKVNYLIDSTRIMRSIDSLPHAIKGRPIRIKLYYPAIKESSSYQLTFLDQIDIFPKKPQLATYNAILHSVDHRLQGQFGPRSDSLERVLFDTKTMAYRDIPHANGKFSLLIYALGLDNHQMENSVLWEFLASHGYIVAVLPSFGVDLEHRNISYNKEGLMGLYFDALFTLNYFKEKPYVDSERIGAIGHSFGGLVVTYLAHEQKIIKGFVSLDGSINIPRAQNILKELEMNPKKITVPLMNLYTKAQGERDLSFVNSLDSPLYQFSFNKASHYDFQNFPLFAYFTKKDDVRVIGMRTTEDGKNMHHNITMLTKHFFSSIFNNDKASKNYIKGISQDSIALKSLGEFKTKNSN